MSVKYSDSEEQCSETWGCPFSIKMGKKIMPASVSYKSRKGQRQDFEVTSPSLLTKRHLPCNPNGLQFYFWQIKIKMAFMALERSHEAAGFG